MKAAVCYAFGEPLVVEEVDIDPPGSGEVRVRVAACAICYSDVHLIRGAWGGPLPVVAGHEAAGVVEALGPGVGGVHVGDHVVVSLLRSCGHCFYCTLGRSYNCESGFALDTESRLRNRQGVRLNHGIRTAAFAEYTVVDQSQVVAIPAEFPLASASLLACGVITGLGAVTHTARIEAGSQVVVIGAGGVGLNAIQGAAIAGASRIIAIDVRTEKLEAARRFGATHTVDARREDAVAAVRALTAGRGADYSFGTVGTPAAIAQTVDMVRKGGTAVIVGMPSNAEATFGVNAHHMTEGRQIMGSKVGSTRLSVDIPPLLDLYATGRLKLDELISGRYPLEQINEAIAALESGVALRNVVVFDQ